MTTASNPPLANSPPLGKKTTLSIDELAEGPFTGTLPGCTYPNGSESMVSTFPPSTITVVIANGEFRLYADTIASSVGTIPGSEGVPSPEYSVIVSGALPLSQENEASVIAWGAVPRLGELMNIYWDADGYFTGWEVCDYQAKYPEGDGAWLCSVRITLVEGLPVAQIVLDLNKMHQTATVPLGLKSTETPSFDGPAVEPPLGSNMDGVYVNTPLDISYTLPEGCMDTTAELQALFATTLGIDQAVFADDAAFAAEVQNSHFAYPLFKCETASGDSVQIDFARKSNDAQAFIEGVVASYQTKEMQEDYQAEAKRADAVIGGQHWAGAQATMVVAGMQVSSAVYARTFGDYVATITVTGISGDPTGLMAGFAAA